MTSFSAVLCEFCRADEVEAAFARRLALDAALGFNHGERLEIRPLFGLGQAIALIERKATADFDPSAIDSPALPPEPAAAPPRHLRVLQMRTDQAEQATSTTFQLRRNAGCWWIEL